MQIMGMDLPEDQRNAPWGSVYALSSFIGLLPDRIERIELLT